MEFQPIRSTGRMAIIRIIMNNVNLMCRVEVYAFDRASLTMPLIGSRDLPGVAVEGTYVVSTDSVDTNRDGVMDVVLVRQIFPPSVGLPPVTAMLGAELLVLEGVEDPLTGGISFPNAVGYPLFYFPFVAGNCAWMDVNRDGWGDYVMRGGGWVVLSDGQGGFLPPTSWSTWNQWGSGLSFQWADFNLDGLPDYVDCFSVLNYAATNYPFEVYVTAAPGTQDPLVFASPQNLRVYAPPLPAVWCCNQNTLYMMPSGLADLDNDGDLDVAFVSQGLTNSTMEGFGVAINDTITAKGCSFSGPVPVIDVGPTLSGHSGRIGLRRANPGDQAYLLVSTGAQSYSGCGGMIPDLSGLLGPQGIFYTSTVSDAGTAGFSYSLPPSATPLNFALYMQWVVTDAANPLAVRLSDLRKVVFW
jgi:hypothetical protein